MVLILKSTEASKTDLWLLPGGRVDVGENNLEEALKRELKEEINLEKISIFLTKKILFSWSNLSKVTWSTKKNN